MEKLEVIFNKVKSELNNKEEIEQFYQNMLSFYETLHNENNKKNKCKVDNILISN